MAQLIQTLFLPVCSTEGHRLSGTSSALISLSGGKEVVFYYQEGTGKTEGDYEGVYSITNNNKDCSNLLNPS